MPARSPRILSISTPSFPLARVLLSVPGVKLVRAVSCRANGLSLREAVRTATEWGLEAIECPADPVEANIPGQSGLGFVAEIATGCPHGDHLPALPLSPDVHLEDLRRKLDTALRCDPLLVTVLAGSDAWDYPETCRFAEAVLRAIRGLPCPVAFTTHRARITYSPWRTARLIEEFPDLWLALDAGPWCAVSERLILDEQGPWRAPILRRVRHIHARVGHEQGPEVDDPRIDRFHHHLKSHLAWWREIITLQAAADYDTFCFTPRHSGPAANEINRWLANQVCQSIPVPA